MLWPLTVRLSGPEVGDLRSIVHVPSSLPLSVLGPVPVILDSNLPGPPAATATEAIGRASKIVPSIAIRFMSIHLAGLSWLGDAPYTSAGPAGDWPLSSRAPQAGQRAGMAFGGRPGCGWPIAPARRPSSGWLQPRARQARVTNSLRRSGRSGRPPQCTPESDPDHPRQH